MPSLPPDLSPSSFSFAGRLALYYGAIFLIVGSHMPFYPLWLSVRGLTEVQIGVVLAAPMLARILFTPIVTYIADWTGNRRTMLLIMSWGTLTALMLLRPLTGFWPILGVTVLFGVFWTSVMPLTETMAMSAVKKDGLGLWQGAFMGILEFYLGQLRCWRLNRRLGGGQCLIGTHRLGFMSGHCGPYVTPANGGGAVTRCGADDTAKGW